MEEEVELPGESVFFVRVKPGTVHKALEELRQRAEISKAEPVLGPYDIVLTGAFKSLADLQKFREELEAKEFCEGCSANPSFEAWIRPEEATRAISAWTLIKAANPERAMEALRQVPAVNRLYTTAGEFNVIANVAANQHQDLMDTILKDIQGIKEVRRTETLAGVSATEGG